MKKLLLLLLLFNTVFCLQAQNDWDLKKDKDGIKIYTRQVSGSKFRAFKAVASTDASVSTLVAVMKDKSAYKALFPLTMEMEVLEEKGETYQVQYVKTDVPFPVTDRDGIYEFKYSFNPGDQSVNVTVDVLADRLPRAKKMVRITEGKGFWKFRPKTDGAVEIEYQFHAEPGGSIPAWLANSQVVDSPWQAITGLLRMAKQEKYQGRTFRFMQ